MWICRFVDCNLYFNIKGRNYNKLLIRQPQENIPHSMFQQDCAPLHFHNEVGMTTLLFFFLGSGVEVARIDTRDRLICSRRVFFSLVLVTIISMFAPYQLRTIHDLQTRIRGACAKMIAKFSVICDRRFNILFTILAPLLAFATNFVNE